MSTSPAAALPPKKVLYPDTLDAFRKSAEKLYPGRHLFGVTEAAKIVGVSFSTLYTKGLRGSFITCEQLAWVFA